MVRSSRGTVVGAHPRAVQFRAIASREGIRGQPVPATDGSTWAGRPDTAWRACRTAAGTRRFHFSTCAAQDAEVGAAVRDAVAAVLDSRQFVLGPARRRGSRRRWRRTAGCRTRSASRPAPMRWRWRCAALGVGPGVDRPDDPVQLLRHREHHRAAGGAARLRRHRSARRSTSIPPRWTACSNGAAVRSRASSRSISSAGWRPWTRSGRSLPVAAAGSSRTPRRRSGARSAGRAAGTFGRAGMSLLLPDEEPRGGIGDGGMVLTADDALAARVRQDRHQGQTAPYVHGSIGLCSRLDAVQAAVAGREAAPPRRLERGSASGRRTGTALRFRDAGLARRRRRPHRAAGRRRARRTSSISLHGPGARRDALVEHLARDGIGTQVYYRTPLHRQPPLAEAALVPIPLPEAERAAREVLALPIYPQLDESRVPPRGGRDCRVLRRLSRPPRQIVSPRRAGLRSRDPA